MLIYEVFDIGATIFKTPMILRYSRQFQSEAEVVILHSETDSPIEARSGVRIFTTKMTSTTIIHITQVMTLVVFYFIQCYSPAEFDIVVDTPRFVVEIAAHMGVDGQAETARCVSSQPDTATQSDVGADEIIAGGTYPPRIFLILNNRNSPPNSGITSQPAWRVEDGGGGGGGATVEACVEVTTTCAGAREAKPISSAARNKNLFIDEWY